MDSIKKKQNTKLVKFNWKKITIITTILILLILGITWLFIWIFHVPAAPYPTRGIEKTDSKTASQKIRSQANGDGTTHEISAVWFHEKENPDYNWLFYENTWDLNNDLKKLDGAFPNYLSQTADDLNATYWYDITYEVGEKQTTFNDFFLNPDTNQIWGAEDESGADFANINYYYTDGVNNVTTNDLIDDCKSNYIVSTTEISTDVNGQPITETNIAQDSSVTFTDPSANCFIWFVDGEPVFITNGLMKTTDSNGQTVYLDQNGEIDAYVNFFKSVDKLIQDTLAGA